jgi:hypothetical protein
MKKFLYYFEEQSLLFEAKANTHLTHLEELVLTKGKTGYDEARNFLVDILSHLQGKSKRKINTSVKWDGCIHPDTMLITTEGKLPISHIIDSEKSYQVLCHDMNTGCNVWNEAKLPRVNNNGKAWVEIELDNGEIFRCTCDHKIFTSNRGWVEAKDLSTEDVLVGTVKNLNCC